MKPIETERLVLEPIQESGLEDFVTLTGDEDVMLYWSSLGAFRGTWRSRTSRPRSRACGSTGSADGGSP